MLVQSIIERILKFVMAAVLGNGFYAYPRIPQLLPPPWWDVMRPAFLRLCSFFGEDEMIAEINVVRLATFMPQTDGSSSRSFKGKASAANPNGVKYPVAYVPDVPLF